MRSSFQLLVVMEEAFPVFMCPVTYAYWLTFGEGCSENIKELIFFFFSPTCSLSVCKPQKYSEKDFSCQFSSEWWHVPCRSEKLFNMSSAPVQDGWTAFVTGLLSISFYLSCSACCVRACCVRHHRWWDYTFSSQTPGKLASDVDVNQLEHAEFLVSASGCHYNLKECDGVDITT